MAVPKSTANWYFEQDLRCQARISHVDMSSSNLAVPALVPVFHRRVFRFWNLFATNLFLCGCRFRRQSRHVWSLTL